MFTSAVARGEDRERARRFTLQCVVAIFSEHIGLLPPDLFVELLDDCKAGASTYDAIGSLFRQMNNPIQARAGRLKHVRYFNGGIFKTVEPIELTGDELTLLADAAEQDWSKVEPAIFGNLFQGSMAEAERHACGAHFTSEADIQRVVLPTIVRPWRERISAAKTYRQLVTLRDALLAYRVLDPTCGSGNFLYVAFRELVRIEMTILGRIYEDFERNVDRAIGTTSLISTRQFFDVDTNPFAVELATTRPGGNSGAVAEK